MPWRSGRGQPAQLADAYGLAPPVLSAPRLSTLTRLAPDERRATYRLD
ncbi:hypothetical protein [Kribbella sp. NPDC006257]